MSRSDGQRLATAWSETEAQLISWRGGYRRMADLARRQSEERQEALKKLEERLNKDAQRAERKAQNNLLIGLAMGALIVAVANN